VCRATPLARLEHCYLPPGFQIRIRINFVAGTGYGSWRAKMTNKIEKSKEISFHVFLVIKTLDLQLAKVRDPDAH
jgi:hypothetical protein